MNKFKKSLFLIAVLSLALIFTACSEGNANEGAINEGVVATVNGKEISQDEYDKALEYYKGYVEYQYGEGTWEAEVFEGTTYKKYYEDYIMDTMTYRLLLLDAAEKDNIIATDEEILAELDKFKVYFQNDEEYNSYLKDSGTTEEGIKDELKKDIIINHYVIEKIENLNPSDDELETIFNDLRMNEKVKASHILVETEEEALKVLERIDKGEDFAELAKELSTDTASGINGGDLDYFEYVQMVQPFSEAAFSMEIGEVSQPVESEFGYHVIKVIDKIVDDEKTAETEESKLKDYFKSYRYEDLLKELKEKAEIVVKES